MKTFFDSFSNGEITLIAAVASAGISGAVSFFTARYVIKHGPNYEQQIKTVNDTIDDLNQNLDSLHETIGALAGTQEELRKQQAEQAQREEGRYEAQEKKEEAARWKPTARIESKIDGLQIVNKLILKSSQRFFLLEVSLLSQTGAQLLKLASALVDERVSACGYWHCVGLQGLCFCSIHMQWQRNLDNRTAFYAVVDCEPAVPIWVQSGDALGGN